MPTSPAKVGYLDLPCPVPYEEIHHEALKCLKQEVVEGFCIDITERRNEKYCTFHSIMVGPRVIPCEYSSEILKTPSAEFDLGAKYKDSKLMLLGTMSKAGRFTSAKLEYDFTHNLALKANAQLTDEPHKSHGLISFDCKGSDCRTQLQIGSGALLGASYIQSVSPRLSFGAQVFWAGRLRKSGFGYAARYCTDKMVATGQFCSSGLIALSYVHKLSKNACLASDLMYNSSSKDITASFGYDYYFQTKNRLRGKIDSNGVVTFLHQHLLRGIHHSFEFDYIKQDFKFGLRFTYPD